MVDGGVDFRTVRSRPRRPTITDVARLADVSKGAASRALNGRPGVATATRRRVEEAARKLGWAPNALARALSNASAGAVGWVILRSAKAHAVDPYFIELFAGIQLGLAGSPTALVVKLVTTLDEEIATYRTWASEGRVDAVLLMDIRTDDPRTSALSELGLQTVAFASRSDRHADAAVVWNDEAALTRTVLDFAYSRGHRRIGWIAGGADLETTETRQEAATAWSRGREVDVAFRFSDLGGESGAAAAEDLVCGGQRATLLCVDSDNVAHAVIGRLHRMGRRVPEDVSLVCWVDSELCALGSPSVTALGHDIVGYGTEIGRRLLELVRTGEIGPPELLPAPRLVVRESVQTLATLFDFREAR